MKIKRALMGLAMVAACAGAGVAVAAPANAATGKNGVLEPGEFGLFYYPNQSGPVFDLYVSDNNFADDVFPGTGIPANDNTESYWNRDVFWWHVFTNAYYTGSHGCLPSGYVGNTSYTFTDTISSAYYSSNSC